MPADATTPAETYDAVIAGGGHNGLVCAAYLARAGLRVKVLERRDRVGGAAVTEEFHPGFRNSVCAYAVSLLNPKVIADLDLHRHGLRIVERPAMNFLPLSGSDYLLTGNGRTKEEIAKFSRRDAARYDDYCAHLERIADALRALVLRPPPNVTEGLNLTTLRELARVAALGKQLGRLGIDGQQELVDLFTLSAADFLDRWFESDPIKALLGFDSIVGTYASPYEPGTAYVLLHHAFGEVNGKKGHWGHAIGGMGAISEAIASNARAHGAEIETGAEIAEILMERDRATGVVLADGRVVRGRTVAANMTLKRLYGELVAKDAQPTAFARRMETFKYGSGTFRMNVALSKLPNFTCLPGAVARDHHAPGSSSRPVSTIWIVPTARRAQAAGAPNPLSRC